MTDTHFYRKLNWQLIAVHFFATIFLIASARQFTYYYYIDYFHLLQNYMKDKPVESLEVYISGKFENMTVGELLYKINLYPLFATFIALIASFLFSLIIGLKKNIFWLNSLIVFITGFLFFRIGTYRTEFGKMIFFSFGNLFQSFGEIYFYLSNVIFLLFISMTLFFSKWTNKFIIKNTVTETSQL